MGLFILNLGYAQNFWTTSYQKNQKLTNVSAKVNLQNQTIYRLDLKALKNTLKKSPHRAKSSGNSDIVITFPNRKGEFETFRVSQTSVLHPDLAKRFPSINSYIGVGMVDKSAVIRFSISETDGFHGMIMRAGDQSEHIDEYSKDRTSYMVYSKDDMTGEQEFNCELRKLGIEKETLDFDNLQQRNANDGTLRRYRLALACTGEYAQFHINDQDISPGATDAVKKAAVLAAMNTTMTRVNGIYETDLGVQCK